MQHYGLVILVRELHINKTNIWIGEKAIVIESDTDTVPHQYKKIRDTQYQIFETTLKKYIPENIH